MTRDLAQEARNKALVLEAFDALFNRRDFEAADRYFSPDYIQHSAGIGRGREGLFALVRSVRRQYESGVAAAEGDYVMIHGRFSGGGRPTKIVVDVLRIQDGRLVEHWDVMEDEATEVESKSGLPMFGERFPTHGAAPERATPSAPGQGWLSLVRLNGTPEFTAAFAPDAFLEASVLDTALVGPDAIGGFFRATSGMYEALAFTHESRDGNKTFLEWYGRFSGQEVGGTTIVSRRCDGRVESVRVYHRPLSVVSRFASELAQRFTRLE